MSSLYKIERFLFENWFESDYCNMLKNNYRGSLGDKVTGHYRDFANGSKLEDHKDFANGSDHYGFFCDMETIKTMEYDKVEYYVVKLNTKYEVRKKPILEPGCTRSANQYNLSISPIRVWRSAVEEPSNLCWCINIPEQSPKQSPKQSCVSIFAVLRLPRNVYAFIICIITAICIYMVIM